MADPAQFGSGIPDLVAVLVRELPPTFPELKAWRTAVREAMTGFDPLREPLAATLRDCAAALRSRELELARIAEMARIAETLPAAAPEEPPEEPPEAPSTALPEQESAPDPHVAQTVPVPAGTRPMPAREAAPELDTRRWSPAERYLYEDIIALFELGDHTGAMTSFERLVMLAPDAEELATFLDKNGDIFLRLYREHLGSMDRVAVPVKERRPVKIPAARAALILDVLRLCDGHRMLKEILKKSKYGELKTLVTVAHLARSGFVEIA